MVVPGRLLADLARLLPDDEVTLEYRAGGGCRARHVRELLVAAEHLQRRGLPAPAGARRRRCTTIDRPRCSRRSSGRSRRVARRVAAGADRDPGSLRGRPADHGRDRLVPSRRSRRRALDRSRPGPRGDHPRARARRSSRASRAAPRTIELGVHENTSSSAPATLADDAPHRRAVPELQAAPARVLRDRGRRLPRAELLDVVRRAGVMAQRNAPLRLRFAEGELTVSAQTQDVGETRESLPARLHRRAARDRLQRRSSCATGSRPSRATTVRLKLINPLRPGLITRGRRLLVPDHADPASRADRPRGPLRDFRSYARLELELEPGLVLVTGANGAGKTNLLEALHVGTQGFSPRARRDVQMIRFGADAARIALGGLSRRERDRDRHRPHAGAIRGRAR